MSYHRVLVLILVTFLAVVTYINGCKDAGTAPPPVPVITSIKPDSGAVNDQIKIEGSGFGDTRGNSQVLFGTVAALQYDEWKNDEIKVRVPANAQTPITVRTNGGRSNGFNFRVLGTGGGGTTDTVRFSTQIQPIFENTAYGCVGCHGGSGNLFLTAGQSYTNLVNVDQQASSSCAGKKRVLPGNANESVLYLRVSGSTCGDRMPKGAPNPISLTDRNLIRDWINQGALNN